MIRQYLQSVFRELICFHPDHVDKQQKLPLLFPTEGVGYIRYRHRRLSLSIDTGGDIYPSIFCVSERHRNRCQLVKTGQSY